MQKEHRMLRNDRGVALMIVLLVTALLVTLIFEFAYGTRVSLRAARNFRDSQRAYFLARSGVNFVGTVMSALRDKAPQSYLEWREWQDAPIDVGPDAALRVRWEDEAGKINISAVYKDSSTYKQLSKLFEICGVSQEALDRICPTANERATFYLLSDLHRYLSDEEYRKVSGFVTVSPVFMIDINTASIEVLQSIGLTAGMAGMVKERRDREPFMQREDMNKFLGPESTYIVGALDVTSNVFKVSSFATVGGYTKQIEAVITRTSSGFTPSYWRVL